MRLASPVYESLPLIYAVIGGLAIGIAYIDPSEPGTAVSLCIGIASEIAALTVFLRRQDYRALRREYSGKPLDFPSNSRG